MVQYTYADEGCKGKADQGHVQDDNVKTEFIQKHSHICTDQVNPAPSEPIPHTTPSSDFDT